jgi:hypothetical protein
MSASLIGHLSSAFRLSTITGSMSLAGSLRNQHHGPSIMGFEDEMEQCEKRPCRQTLRRSKQTDELISSIVPRGTSFPPLGGGRRRRDAVEVCCGQRRTQPLVVRPGGLKSMENHAEQPKLCLRTLPSSDPWVGQDIASRRLSPADNSRNPGYNVWETCLRLAGASCGLFRYL